MIHLFITNKVRIYLKLILYIDLRVYISEDKENIEEIA